MTEITPGINHEKQNAATILVQIEADDLDGGYVASVVGLPGCVSEGETVGDALRNIAEAYEGVRDTLVTLDKELKTDASACRGVCPGAYRTPEEVERREAEIWRNFVVR